MKPAVPERSLEPAWSSTAWLDSKRWPIAIDLLEVPRAARGSSITARRVDPTFWDAAAMFEDAELETASRRVGPKPASRAEPSNPPGRGRRPPPTHWAPARFGCPYPRTSATSAGIRRPRSTPTRARGAIASHARGRWFETSRAHRFVNSAPCRTLRRAAQPKESHGHHHDETKVLRGGLRGAPMGDPAPLQHRNGRLRQASPRQAGDGVRGLPGREPMRPGGKCSRSPRKPRTSCARTGSSAATASQSSPRPRPRPRPSSLGPGNSARSSSRCRCSTVTRASGIGWRTRSRS